MEKKFTLMKTLTAVRYLVFPRNKKNSRAVTNDLTSLVGCGTNTIVSDPLKYTNDPDRSGSFLLFEQTLNSQESGVGTSKSLNNDQKIKSKDPDSYRESKKVNDELAQKSIPNPLYKNWRERVNDDLAACCPVVSKESVIVSRESITVSNVLKNIFPTTTLHNETRTKKNDPEKSGSFYFITMIISVVSRSFKKDEPNKNLKPVFIPVRPYSKSKMRF